MKKAELSVPDSEQIKQVIEAAKNDIKEAVLKAADELTAGINGGNMHQAEIIRQVLTVAQQHLENALGAHLKGFENQLLVGAHVSEIIKLIKDS